MNMKANCIRFALSTSEIAFQLVDHLGIKFLARPNWKNNWEVAIFHRTRRSLLLRRPGWTDNPFWIVFEWLAKVRIWSL